MSNRNLAAWTLISVPSVWLLLFFVIPVLLMALFSLRPDSRVGLLTFGWTPTLNNYRIVLEGGSYMYRLGLSLQVAFIVASLGTLLSYPLAYFLVFRAQARASLLLTLLILPFWTSYLLRIIAWRIILSGTLLNTIAAVIVTLVYVWLPFAALPIYAALQRIDRSLLEAAANLGAPPWMAFLRVTLPLSLPGVIATFLMVFIPTVGEYVTPALVGGPSGSLFGNIIETFFGDGLKWPLGSAMALIMLVGVLALVVFVARLIDLRRFLG